MTDQLILPFKPFTLDQVSRITGCPKGFLDRWLMQTVHLMTGEDGVTQGFDYAGTFAVYCGRRYLEEGAPPNRATMVVRMVAGMHPNTLNNELLRGNTFPVPGELGTGIDSMTIPPKTRLGRALNLKVLLEEFKAAVAKEFPNG